jgi:hypothetical protein
MDPFFLVITAAVVAILIPPIMVGFYYAKSFLLARKIKSIYAEIKVSESYKKMNILMYSTTTKNANKKQEGLFENFAKVDTLKVYQKSSSGYEDIK